MSKAKVVSRIFQKLKSKKIDPIRKDLSDREAADIFNSASDEDFNAAMIRKDSLFNDEIKKIAKEEGISLKQAKEIVETNLNEYLGNYDRGGDVVKPNKPLIGAARKLAKGLSQGKEGNFKPKTAQQRFLTGFASGVFKMTPADRYMKTYGKQPRAKTRKNK